MLLQVYQVSSICLSRDRSIASSKLRSPNSAILSLSPDEESRIFFGETQVYTVPRNSAYLKTLYQLSRLCSKNEVRKDDQRVLIIFPSGVVRFGAPKD
jgi:hypothetical protein